MQFIWDEKKEKINIIKHGMTFSMAAQVFFDAYRVELYDEAHSVFEDRYISIGFVKEVTCFVTVVYTERGDSIRIISARKSTDEERGWYYGHLCGY